MNQNNTEGVLANGQDTLPENQAELLDDQPQEVKADLRKFNRTELIVNKTLAELATIKDLKDDAAVTTAMTTMKAAKSVETTIENKRKELVKPFNDEVSRINTYAKTLSGKIGPAIEAGKKEVLKFNEEKEKLRIAQRTTERIALLTTIGFILQDSSYQFDGIIVPKSVVEIFNESQWPLEVTRINNEIEKNKQAKLEQLKSKIDASDFFGDSSDEVKKEIEQIASAPPMPMHIPSFGGGSSSGSGVKGLTKKWGYDLVDLSLVPREYLQLDTKKIQEAINAGTRSIPGLNILQKESITLR